MIIPKKRTFAHFLSDTFYRIHVSNVSRNNYHLVDYIFIEHI